MDSDEDDQIISTKKNATKKTRGRGRPSSKTKPQKKIPLITKANNKTKNKKSNLKSQMEVDSDDEGDKELDEVGTDKNKKISSNNLESKTNLEDLLNTSNSLFNNHGPTSSIDLFKKLDVDSLSNIPSPPITFGSATSRLNVPLHENKPLNWDHKVNLIGDKSLSQRVYLCEVCNEPILFYGRLIPCKHVFCFDCAIQIKESNVCKRCNEKIIRIERNSLSTTYICIHDKCRRTYLSQRDLFAHMQHRHTKKDKTNNSEKILSAKLRRGIHLSNPYNYSDELKNGHHHHSHTTSNLNFPQPSLHTLQWTTAVAAASSNAAVNGQFIPPNTRFSATSTSASSWLSLNNNRAFYP